MVYNERIIYAFAGAYLQIAYTIKQLNSVWLTCVLVKFYCNVITNCSLLKLRLTPSILNFMPFQWDKKEEGRPMIIKSKLNGAVDESFAS